MCSITWNYGSDLLGYEIHTTQANKEVFLAMDIGSFYSYEIVSRNTLRNGKNSLGRDWIDMTIGYEHTSTETHVVQCNSHLYLPFLISLFSSLSLAPQVQPSHDGGGAF